MNESSPIIFAVSAILLLGMPGPTNALLATAGAARGLRGAPVLIAAELAGYGAALALLLSLNEIAGAFRGEIGLVLRAAAATLLIVNAWGMWRGAGARGKAARGPGPANVFLLTAFNPKVLILGFVLMPPVVAQAGLSVPALILAGIVVATGFCWVAAGAATRRLPGQPGVAVARLSSIVIGAFACYFALTVAMDLMAPVAA